MMSIRKKWLKILITIGLIAIIVTTIIFSIFMRPFFATYMEDRYEKQVEGIKKVSELILENRENIDNRQLYISLENYLDEPIKTIKIKDKAGNIIVNINRNNMMMNHMHSNIAGIDTFPIKIKDFYVGSLVIERSSSIHNSEINMKFIRTLIINSIFSGLTVLILLIIASIIISKSMSKELINTAKDAEKADSKVLIYNKPSNIKEIYDIQNSLSNLSKKLKLKEKFRKQSIDAIIHETRTPITVLKSNLEGILDNVVSIDENRLEILLNEINKLGNTIEKLDEKIIDSKESIKIKIENINLYSILEKMIKGLELKFNQKNLKLYFLYEGNHFVKTDESLIIQIIYNLLNNSYKYTKSGGKVELKVNIKDGSLKIIVNDTGIGISTKVKDKVFQPYYRENKSENVKGEGIGLYIVKKNVEAFNGKIELISNYNEGTKIIIDIPLSKDVR